VPLFQKLRGATPAVAATRADRNALPESGKDNLYLRKVFLSREAANVPIAAPARVATRLRLESIRRFSPDSARLRRKAKRHPENFPDPSSLPVFPRRQGE